MSDDDKDVEFNHEQLADWRAFEKVRAGGRFNMFDPRARKATGLSGEKYSFVMQNYSKLRDAQPPGSIK